MSNASNFSITNTTKSRLPRLPFLKIKNTILGKAPCVDLAIISNAHSQKLNKKYRGINKPANILTFPMGKTGEILMNPSQIRKDIKRFQKPYDALFALMFIHGLLHLKGRRHSSKMEKEEEVFLKKFGLS